MDTHSYAAALRSSLREAPDVILIGEIRDRLTMEAALELCNTGHLAVSTMHSNNANQALERVVNLFPQVAAQAALHGPGAEPALHHLAAARPRRATASLVAAIEILVSTPHIAELILKGDIDCGEGGHAGERGEGHADLRRFPVRTSTRTGGSASTRRSTTPTPAPTSRPRSTSADPVADRVDAAPAPPARDGPAPGSTGIGTPRGPPCQ